MDRDKEVPTPAQGGFDRSETERTRKQVTLYDAVAGRVGYEGFLTEQQPSRYRDTASSTHVALPPEEILFRRKGAPVRFAEDDIYAADRQLQPHQKLPDSDLLKTVHAYIPDRYGKDSRDSSDIESRSLDETALLAIGILLEEAATHALGRTGDLAFVESSEVPFSGRSSDMYWTQGQPQSSVVARREDPRSGFRLQGLDERLATNRLRRP